MEKIRHFQGLYQTHWLVHFEGAEDEFILLCHQTLLRSSTTATKRPARQLLLESRDHG